MAYHMSAPYRKTIDYFAPFYKYADAGDLKGVISHFSVTNLTKSMKDGSTALHAAAAKGHVHIVAFLMELGGIAIFDLPGPTPYEVAKQNGQQEVVDYFLYLARKEEEPVESVVLDRENTLFNERLLTALPHPERAPVLNNEQMTWLREEFKMFDNNDLTHPSPLQKYLNCSANFPIIQLPQESFGSFEFIAVGNQTALDIPLRLLEEKGIKPEHFVDILTAFVLSSEASFYLSERDNTLYPFKKLVPGYSLEGGEYLQIHFRLNVGLAMTLALANLSPPPPGHY